MARRSTWSIVPGEAGSTLSSCRTSGLLRALRRTLPHVRVHASTQMNTHNTPDDPPPRELGVSRVTLAREVSIGEIAAFVGGSRRRSRVIRTRRAVHVLLGTVPHVVADRAEERQSRAVRSAVPAALRAGRRSGEVIGTPGAHLLSPKDLAGISVLPQLVESGVAALKIEGRMKSPEYVALVTGVYRAALDRAIADRRRLRECATAKAQCSPSRSRADSAKRTCSASVATR